MASAQQVTQVIYMGLQASQSNFESGLHSITQASTMSRLGSNVMDKSGLSWLAGQVPCVTLPLATWPDNDMM